MQTDRMPGFYARVSPGDWIPARRLARAQAKDGTMAGMSAFGRAWVPVSEGESRRGVDSADW